MCTPTSLPVFRYNNSGDFLQVQDKKGLINTIMLLSGNLCQQKSWRFSVLPPSWSRQRCGKAPMLTTALKRSPQVVQRNSFKTFEDIVVFVLYIWPPHGSCQENSLFVLRFGDWLLKTLLGSSHLLPGSLEGLQHGVHTGEKRGRAESIHQELPVVASPTSTWIVPHQKCFCLDRVDIRRVMKGSST